METNRGLIEIEKIIGQRFIETEHLFIVPAGHIACYSTNDENEVIGLKLGYLHGKRKDRTNGNVDYAYLLDRIIHYFPKIERLVLVWTNDVLSSRFTELVHLSYLWIGGKELKVIPEDFFNLKLDFIESEDSFRDNFSIVRDIEKVDEEDLLKDKKYKFKLESASIPVNYNLDQFLSDSNTIKGLWIESSNVEDPPIEIIRQGNQALKKYFENLIKGEKPLNEIKVIFVGEGGAGKTSLMKRILKEKFDPNEKQTHGINIKSINQNKIKINFWDFGGQEIMHSTHQFFLSKRSFYVLILDGRKEENPEYWLKHIQSFGGNSNVLIVLNKIDQNPSFEVNRRFLIEKYKNIVGFSRISCSNKQGFNDFMEVFNDEISKLSILNTKWPIAWFRVKSKLENLKASYISYEDFYKVCDSVNIKDEKSIDVLVSFLHDLGIVLHFEDLNLSDTHVLDPRWVTEGVYKIVNSKLLAGQQGEISFAQISSLLQTKKTKNSKYPKNCHNYIIQLMLKFELCYKLDDDSLLIPDLLGIQEPELPDWENDYILFIFQFSYLPKSLIARFIVRIKNDIHDNKRWRTGVYLKEQDFDTESIVKADLSENKLSIKVHGENSRQYLTILRKTIYDIIRTYEKLDYQEFVPISNESNILIEYDELIGHEREGKELIFIGRLRKDFNVSVLLDGFEKREERIQKGSSYSFNGNVYFNTNTNNETNEVMRYQSKTWEKILVYSSAILFLGLLGFLLIRNEEFADQNLVVLMRIVLSFAVSVLGATIPGFLNISFDRKGLMIRAGGALGLFVLTFLLTPKVL